MLWRENQPELFIEAIEGSPLSALLTLLLDGKDETVIRGSVLLKLQKYYVLADHDEWDQLAAMAATGPFKVQEATHFSNHG